MKTTNVTAEYLKSKGGQFHARSKKFDGGCVLPSQIWVFPNGKAYHFIQYRPTPGGINTRLLPSSRRFPYIKPDPPAPLFGRP